MAKSPTSEFRLPEWLNYRHLYAFFATASAGSLSAASKALRVGSPTLSLQIGALEDALGQPLFRRAGRSIEVTETGRLALEYARGIFELGDELLNAARGHDPGQRLQLNVGVPDSVPKALCSRLVKLARRERAQSTLLLKEGAGDGLFRDLLEHRLDLVLADEKPSPTRFPGLASRSLGRLPVVICGAPRFQGLRKAFPNSLNGQPFLLPSVEHPLRGELEAFLRKYKVKVDPVVEALDMSLQKLLAAQGLGLIAMVKPAASALLRDKRLVEIGTCSGVHEEFFLVHAPRRVPHPLAESLLRSFRM